MEKDTEVIEIGIDCLEMDCKKKSTIDIENSFKYLNFFFIFLFLILILVFFIQIKNGLFELDIDKIDITNFTYKYSNYKKSGNYIGIFTSFFLHGSIEHIVSNLIFLYIFSLIIYRLFNFWKSIMFFLLFGIISGVFSYFLNVLPSLGSSGAIFGLFGLSISFYFAYKDKLSKNLLDLSWVLFICAGYQIICGFIYPYIDNIAHISGYLSGFIIGYFLFKYSEKDYL